MEQQEVGEPDEQRLVENAQHDPQAFGVLYDRYVERIYAFAYRRTNGNEDLAADITSATFEQALRHIRGYRWQGYSFGAWLYKIARNEIAQHYRRSRILQFLGLEKAQGSAVDQELELSEQRDSIQAALAKLSESDREIITLRFFDDLSSAEVGEVLGCSVANVYLRLHRALARLRKYLDDVEIKGEFDVSK